MAGGTMRIFVLTLGVMASFVVQPARLEAGCGFFEWLFSCCHAPRVQPVPVVTYYPTSVVPATPAMACGIPVPQQAVVPVPQQTLVQYAPEVRFRTVWATVPVTQFRPVVVAQPVTAVPTTTMQACSTFEWQARRAPYTAFAPVYSTFPAAAVGGLAPTSYTTPMPSAGTFAPGYANGAAFSPGIGVPSTYGCSPAGATPVAPAQGSYIPYAPPSSVAPAQGSYLPSAPPGSPGLTPLAPPASAPVPGAASQIPRLGPSDIPAAEKGAPTNGTNGQQDSTTHADPGASSPSQPTAPNAGNGSHGADEATRGTTGKTLNDSGIKPIPDPDRQLEPWNRNNEPPLVGPGERTARRSRPNRWAAVPISWPDPQPASRAAHHLPADAWDDSGWTSASSW